MALDYFTVYARFLAYLAEQAPKETKPAEQATNPQAQGRVA